MLRDSGVVLVGGDVRGGAVFLSTAVSNHTPPTGSMFQTSTDRRVTPETESLLLCSRLINVCFLLNDNPVCVGLCVSTRKYHLTAGGVNVALWGKLWCWCSASGTTALGSQGHVRVPRSTGNWGKLGLHEGTVLRLNLDLAQQPLDQKNWIPTTVLYSPSLVCSSKSFSSLWLFRKVLATHGNRL